VKASETTVRQVLQGETQFVVPLDQRRYSWEHDRDKDPLGQLWNDLLQLVGDGGTGTHFLGSIVLAPSPTNTAGGITRWIVVDGQQRLTTLSVLLCAIRDRVEGEDGRLAEKIHAGGMDRYRLLPTQEDRASWIALVDRTPGAGGEDRIGGAYRYFRAKLAEFDDPDDESDVRELEQTVTGRLALVSISAHADDNVHRIFESLNHKGQPLTQADLLRNYVFMRLPTRGDEIYTTHWLPLQQMLNDTELDELVWLDLVLRGDEKATQGAIYRSQQLRLDALGEDAIAEWVVQLHHRARLFQRILAPEKEPVAVIRTALGRLGRWGSTVVHPIALHVLEAHEGGAISGAEAARALRVVESFQVRRMLVGIPTNNLNRILMSLVKDLGERVPTAEAVTEALSGRAPMATDEPGAGVPTRRSMDELLRRRGGHRIPPGGGWCTTGIRGHPERPSCPEAKRPHLPGLPLARPGPDRRSAGCADGRGHPVRRVVARRSGAAHVSRRPRCAPLRRSRGLIARGGPPVHSLDTRTQPSTAARPPGHGRPP
jgi:Protein of unknown function DUF262